MVTVQQFTVALDFVSEDLTGQVVGVRPGITFNILEGHINHGVFALKVPIVSSASPDFLAFEIDGGVLFRFLKENPQHIHIQCFSKPPGAGKERNHRALVEKIFDHQGLVNIVVVGGGQTVITDPDGQRKNCRLRGLDICPRFDALVDRLLGTGWDSPATPLLGCPRDVPIAAVVGYLAIADAPACGGFFGTHVVCHCVILLPPLVMIILWAKFGRKSIFIKRMPKLFDIFPKSKRDVCCRDRNPAHPLRAAGQ